MPTLFISYRRSDSHDVTGRIYDRLIAKYAKEEVFRDVDNIPLGISFPTHLQQVLNKASIVLVIIGPNWVGATDAKGRRRLDDPNDFVRVEVECALRAQIPVIPILVSNAHMPSAEQLPAPMQPLAVRNGIAVRPDPDFHNDISRLLSGISKLETLLSGQAIKGKPRPKRIPQVIPGTDAIFDMEIESGKDSATSQRGFRQSNGWKFLMLVLAIGNGLWGFVLLLVRPGLLQEGSVSVVHAVVGGGGVWLFCVPACCVLGYELAYLFARGVRDSAEYYFRVALLFVGVMIFAVGTYQANYGK